MINPISEHFLSHFWCSGAFGTGTRQVLLLALMANEMAKQGTLKKHACKTPDTHGPSNPWYFLGIFQETSHFFLVNSLKLSRNL
jgi:hypothetical protein